MKEYHLYELEADERQLKIFIKQILSFSWEKDKATVSLIWVVSITLTLAALEIYVEEVAVVVILLMARRTKETQRKHYKK